LLGGLWVVTLAGVIEKRMAGSGESTNFISKASRLERRLRAVSGRVHSFVLLPVYPIDGGLGLAEVGVFGRGPIEGGRQPPCVVRQLGAGSTSFHPQSRSRPPRS